MSNIANKFDDGKDPWHLVPWDAVKGIVKVLGFGARKYSERNWEKGMDWSRCYGALTRHLTAWWQGEDKDSETGYSHLWHAGCSLFFLIAYEERGVGKDDRPQLTEQKVGFVPPRSAPADPHTPNSVGAKASVTWLEPPAGA